MLVVRHHARGTFLQRLRKSPTSCSRRLLHFFWLATKAEHRRCSSRKGVLSAEPETAPGLVLACGQTGAGVEPGAEFATQRRLSDIEGSDQAHGIFASS